MLRRCGIFSPAAMQKSCSLCFSRRGGEALDRRGRAAGIWEDDWESTDRIPLADPDLVTKFAALIAISLPKKSKYAKKDLID
jgi:hypothetical protein